MIDTKSNVVLLCDGRSSNGCIIQIDNNHYVASVGHGVLTRQGNGDDVALRGDLVITLFDWTRLYYEPNEENKR